MSEWQFSDAWFLEAVAQSESESNGAVLSHVINSGDWINRSVFNRDEIERAVQRLVAAGLLVVADDHFRLSSEAIELRLLCAEATAFERITWLREMLVGRYPCDDTNDWHLSASDYAQAVQANRDWFAAQRRRRN